MRLYQILIGALLRHRTITLEWFLALEALCCGLWILAPWPAFSDRTILIALPERLVGTVFVLHGGFAVYVLVRENGPMRPRSQKNLDLCRRSALASAMFWSAILASFAVVNPTSSLAVPVFLGFIVASLVIYLRLYLRYTP